MVLPAFREVTHAEAIAEYAQAMFIFRHSIMIYFEPFISYILATNLATDSAREKADVVSNSGRIGR